MKNTLTFAMQSYWHIGAGQEGGAYADALALKNPAGLPYLPGKSIKGLMKEAFKIAQRNNWFDTNIDSLITVLFGCEHTAGSSAQGLLQFTSAELSPEECAYFTAQPSHKKKLYKVIASTAIDAKSGVAKKNSLRSIEVCVPITLNSLVELNTNHPNFQRYCDELTEKLSTWLAAVVSLVTELGAKRHRGLGQAFVTSTQVSGE